MLFGWPKKFDIEKDVAGEKVLYLRRWFLFRSSWCNIYLHWIAAPDGDADPHNHPWSFVSLVLRGGYHEERFAINEQGRYVVASSDRTFASIAFRSSSTVHWIDKVLPNTYTLVITGPRKSEWEFLNQDGMLVNWRCYLGLPSTLKTSTDPNTKRD